MDAPFENDRRRIYGIDIPLDTLDVSPATVAEMFVNQLRADAVDTVFPIPIIKEHPEMAVVVTARAAIRACFTRHRHDPSVRILRCEIGALLPLIPESEADDERTTPQSHPPRTH
jgi:hypothetical protein